MTSARQLRAALQRRDVTATDVAEDALARAERDTHNAFQTILGEQALAEAAKLDRMRTSDRPIAPLWGMPLAHKDNVAVAGAPTAHGSRAVPHTIATSDDPVVKLLRDAGTINLGKTQVPEFAISGYSENDIAPPVRNPHNPELTAGGSSSGAAAAVALGLLPFAPGNDGGGSIRIPAAACGVVGLQPSRDALPIDRVSPGTEVSHAPRLSVSGPLARTAGDAALLFDSMGGSGAIDACDRADSVSGLRIGVTTASPFDDTLDIHLDREIQTGLDAAVSRLLAHGHRVDDAQIRYLPGYEQAFTDNWQGGFSDTEFTTDQVERLGAFTRYSYERGRSLSVARREHAIEQLWEIAAHAGQQWSRFDVVLTPTVAWLPPRIGTFESVPVAENFRLQCEWMPYTSITNVAGYPAISVPTIRLDSGLKVSVQLIGGKGRENQLLQLAAQLELDSGE
ncbi:MAG: amidase [Canibacter sp.]